VISAEINAARYQPRQGTRIMRRSLLDHYVPTRRLRGPNGSGIDDARPLPVTWDGEKSVNILWKTLVPGLGHSSPAIWGERIFLTSAISSAEKAHHNPKDAGIDPSTDASVHSKRPGTSQD
jgi:hypothetical protein